MENNTHALTWEDVTPTLIPNTIMQKRMVSDTSGYYKIAPIEGYALHDKGRDTSIFDPDTMEELGTQLGYTGSYTTCSVAYDFTPCVVTDENGVQHTAYGAREFFSRPRSEVPGDQIYGGGNDHEVM